MIYNKYSTKEKRRTLKKEMTESEKILWESIRRDALGVRFRRQYGIGEYIADFYCPSLKLVIELDGAQHYSDNGLAYDEIRRKFLNTLGIKTIRFSNNEVLTNLENVLKIIKTEIENSNKKSK